MKTHWKKLVNTDYLGSYSIDPEKKTLTVTIVDVKKEIVKGDGGKEGECIVAYLKDQKPMILNRTNCKTITKLYDSAFIEDWKGKQITLYVEKVRAFGDIVEGLRVKQSIPELPELTPDAPQWESAKASVKAGQVTIDQIKKHYKLTPENETQLQN